MIQRMEDKDYFAIDAVSNSLLGRLAKCPANMLIEREQSPAMSLGSLAHCLILEGKEEFFKRFAVLPECDRRTKEGKAIYQSFCEANDGKTVITLEQLQDCVGMAESVASHPSCRELLSNGTPEVAITWEEDGEQCKAKADWLTPDVLIDLKTTTNSEYIMFSRTILNSNYHRQMAFYRSGLRANGIFPKSCIIIAVESSAPYTVSVFSLASDLLTLGEGQYKELLRKYKQVKDMDTYPAYLDAGIQEVYAPAWAKGII